jgi:hypothetical protein
LLAEHGVPHLGYAAVGRELPDQLGQLELNSVQEGAQLIARVVESLGRSSAAERA